MDSITNQRNIFSVSKLNKQIKSLLEENFPFIWMTGEISNFSRPSSGHFYFTLKDNKSQISSVIFRGQNRNLTFIPENGMKITGFGRISLYEPRGAYQIIFEYLEPSGIGNLQVAFDQLKNKLLNEGIFEEHHKKELPFLPKKISIITSPTGAVVHDIINVVNRRYKNIHIQIVPVKVQGEDSSEEICEAFELINNRFPSDTIILARGGGSLEDMEAFNSELVARSIFKSEIPVISSVGHETDFTIADFTADVRASTPSVAAELVVPLKNDLQYSNRFLLNSLKSRFLQIIEQKKNRLENLAKRIKNPKKAIQEKFLRVDDFSFRMARVFKKSVQYKRETLLWKKDKLIYNNPSKLIQQKRDKLNNLNDQLKLELLTLLDRKKSKINEINGKLTTLNPTAILERGYSITRTIQDSKIIKNSDKVKIGEDLEILVAKGRIKCRVEEKI